MQPGVRTSSRRWHWRFGDGSCSSPRSTGALRFIWANRDARLGEVVMVVRLFVLPRSSEAVSPLLKSVLFWRFYLIPQQYPGRKKNIIKERGGMFPRSCQHYSSHNLSKRIVRKFSDYFSSIRFSSSTVRKRRNAGFILHLQHWRKTSCTFKVEYEENSNKRVILCS